MSNKARFLLGLLVAGMMGVWLNGCAVIVVASTNGLPGPPSPMLEIIYAANWPTALAGVPCESYFDPNLGTNLLRNVLCWTGLGLLVNLLPRRESRR